MDLSIIGSGYVGLVTGACFADVGHNVICVDNDLRKVEALQAGKVPIFEPGLEEVIHRNVSARRCVSPAAFKKPLITHKSFSSPFRLRSSRMAMSILASSRKSHAKLPVFLPTTA